MIVDLMRNDLGRVCETGSVRVTDLLSVQPHPGVWHLVSTVTGRLRADVGDAALLAATFPPGRSPGRRSCARSTSIAAARGRSARRVHRRGRLRRPARARGSASRSARLSSTGPGSRWASAAASPPTACRCWSGANAWTRRRRWSRRSVATTPSRCPSSRRRPRHCAPVAWWKRCSVVDGVAVRVHEHLARLDRSMRELYGRACPGRWPTGPGWPPPGARRDGSRCACTRAPTARSR